MRRTAHKAINLDEYATKGDPRRVPAYGIAESAAILQIPAATLRSWVLGRRYPTDAGERFFKPVILLPDSKQHLLSFMNLVEAHVLSAMRRRDRIALVAIRRAVEYVRRSLRSTSPLVDASFLTDGIELFVERFGALVCASQGGQLAMRELLKGYLSRIDRDSSGLPIRLYPFTRGLPAGRDELDQPRAIAIDPFVSFGRPVLAGTGIPVDVIVDRYEAGESIESLARDFRRGADAIEEAIRCALRGRRPAA